VAGLANAIPLLAIYGLINGATYALISLGFTLLFGVARLLNLVYGALYMVAGYTIYYLTVLNGVSVYLAAPLAIGIVVAVGLAVWLLFVRRAIDPMRFMIGTLLVALFLEYFFSYAFGGQVGYIIPGLVANRSLLIFGVSVGWLSILAAGVSILLVVVLYLWVERSAYGRTLRATAEDPETASLFGISPFRVALLVVVLSSVLIGLAAVLVVPSSEVTPSMWIDPFVIAFVVAIIGGLGKFLWTLPAAFLLSFSQVVASYYIPYDVSDLVAFAVAIGFILAMPRGFGGIWEKHRVG
jgi:branched-chain amino acid transport system permease protein